MSQIITKKNKMDVKVNIVCALVYSFGWTRAMS